MAGHIKYGPKTVFLFSVSTGRGFTIIVPEKKLGLAVGWSGIRSWGTNRKEATAANGAGEWRDCFLSGCLAIAVPRADCGNAAAPPRTLWPGQSERATMASRTPTAREGGSCSCLPAARAWEGRLATAYGLERLRWQLLD